MVEILQEQNLEEIYENSSLKSKITSQKAPEINTLVFDLGGVYFTAGSTLAIEKIIKYFNVEDIEKVKYIFSNKYNSPANLIRRGLISIEKFEDLVVSELNIPKEDRHYIRHFWFGSYVPNYKMEEIVKKLAEDYRLIIFSGNVKERIVYLNSRYDFLKFFDDYVFSYDYHMNKRDMKLYEELLNHLGCEPFQAILIDDCFSNIKRASLIGLNGIHYAYTEQFIEELRDFNIDLTI